MTNKEGSFSTRQASPWVGAWIQASGHRAVLAVADLGPSTHCCPRVWLRGTS